MIGVIIGRFQVPKLHAGHMYLIGTALQECDRVFIALGTIKNDAEPDERNPYDYDHRSEIIGRIFPNLIIKVIKDKDNDEEWSAAVDKMCDNIAAYMSNPNIVLYHSRDSFKDHYKGKYKTREIPELPGFSGTQMRKEAKDEEK